MTQQFHFWYIPQRIENRDLKRCLYTHVHISIIHKSQEVEATQMSTDWLTDRENVVYIHNRIYEALKRKKNSDTCYNVNKPRGHYTN